MKRVILFLTILFPSIIFSQSKYYTFSELRGMEDQSGNTHLFYGMYYSNINSSIYKIENSIYHLNLESGTDTLFLRDVVYQDEYQSSFSYVSDYKFWNRNPSKYIYCGSWAGGMDITLHAFVKRFDTSYGITFYNTSFSSSLEISRQNDSLVIANIGSACKSTDGGRSWDTLSTNYNFISLDPFNDQILFCSKNEGGLYKSIDQGKSFYLVDTVMYSLQKGKMLFYKDGKHIYYLENGDLFSSNNNGETSTWKLIYTSNNNIYVSLDSIEAGDLYVADGRTIFHSSNYGNSFTLFKKLDHDIVGIYKKPDTDKLYASTKYNLFEISGDSIRTLMSLPIDPKILNYYPLAIGNKWIYNVSGVSYEPDGPHYFNYIIQKRVLGDTTMSNEIKYFIIKEDYKGNTFERIDSANGKIYAYTSDSSITNNEGLIDDLSAMAGDTIYSNYSTRYYGKYTIFEKEDTTKEFDSSFISRKYSVHENLSSDIYDLTDGIGIDYHYYEFDFGYATETLKGAVLKGVVYGDTTITDIKDKNKIPLEFSLYQNYPNPFNPSTTIKYVIPKENNVTIKIFDVLGREVETLLNTYQKAGQHEVNWNAKNFSSGIYFYQIRAGNFIATKKMLLIK